ncbi:MAG: OmpA family protein [Planctomycetota bacterium]
MRTGKLSWALGIAALGALFSGGCAAVSEDEYQAALSENQELRERLVSLNDALDQCEADRSELVGDNRDLAARVTDLQGSLAEASQSNDAGGFRGIPGASTSTRDGNLVVAVEGDVLFASGKVDLRSESRQTLDRIARVINDRWSAYDIRVEGYTDSDPIRKSKWDSNEHLSAARALAVEKYLVSKGVDNDRIYSAAFGPSNPRANKTQSRRVEIVILGQRGS